MTGLAVARRFAEAGANVMVRVAAELAGSDGPVAWFAAHAADPEQAAACVAATVDRFGGLDVPVNNAATSPHFGPMVDIDRTRAEKTMALNQFGPLAWVQAAWRATMADAGGSVVNVVA